MADGILLVDKPSGPTSAEVVRLVKRRHRVAAIGHLGTLDPMATGLLPLCLGSGTRIAQFLAAERKAYEGEIELGIATDTLDLTGHVVGRAEVPPLTLAELRAVSRGLLGRRGQVPPMYSAVKVAGRKLYELARQGQEVERTTREIEVFAFELEAATPSPPRLRFAVECSKGTYVRVMAEEVGRALGTLAALAELRRTRFGAFSIQDAHPLEVILAREPGELPVITNRAALRSAREIEVDGHLAFAIAAGQRAALGRLDPPRGGDRLAALVAPNGGLLAVLEAEGGAWRLRRVLMSEACQLYRP